MLLESRTNSNANSSNSCRGEKRNNSIVVVDDNDNEKVKKDVMKIDDVTNIQNVNTVVDDDVEDILKFMFPSSFSIFTEFLQRWIDIVPELTNLSSSSSSSSLSVNNTYKTKENDMNTKSIDNNVKCCNNNEDGGDNQQNELDNDDNDVDKDLSFAEQIGCPDDTDFNRWSHHCHVHTADDELLVKSLVDDDSTVSFIFGLEVYMFMLLLIRMMVMIIVMRMIVSVHVHKCT